MIRNAEKHAKARDFRKRGFTYSEISKMVGVSPSTLSLWFAKQSFSKKVRVDNEKRSRRDNVKRISLVNKARGKEREERYKEAVKAADTEFKHYKHLPHFVRGVVVYSSVGDLSQHRPIRLPSQKKHLHKIFHKFLQEFLGIEKQKIYQTDDITIVNDAVRKKKLVRWCDLICKYVDRI